jgi:hypothetical protein
MVFHPHSQYSQRHSVINHCDRCITHLGDLDKSFVLLNIFSKFLLPFRVLLTITQKAYQNQGNAKRGVSPRLKIWSGDLDLWPWKSTGFQILLRTKYVPSLVKIHWRMLILECSQGWYAVNNLTWWPWTLTLKINRVSDFLKD